jgi:hypothetical protein
MAAWLIPALKVVLPHLGTIISVAKPVFTKKTPGADQAALVQRQVSELQAAVSENATHIKELAAAAVITDSRLRHAYLLCAGAFLLSVVSLAVALLGT